MFWECQAGAPKEHEQNDGAEREIPPPPSSSHVTQAPSCERLSRFRLRGLLPAFIFFLLAPSSNSGSEAGISVSYGSLLNISPKGTISISGSAPGYRMTLIAQMAYAGSPSARFRHSSSAMSLFLKACSRVWKLFL